VARLRLGFESALARESLRRGDGASCQRWIGPGSLVGPQGWGSSLPAWQMLKIWFSKAASSGA